MDTNLLLNSYLTRKNYTQDKQIAHDLGITSGQLCSIRKNRKQLNDLQVIFIAKELEIDVEIALTARNKDRAKNPEIKASYERILKTLTQGKSLYIPMSLATLTIMLSAKIESLANYALCQLMLNSLICNKN